VQSLPLKYDSFFIKVMKRLRARKNPQLLYISMMRSYQSWQENLAYFDFAQKALLGIIAENAHTGNARNWQRIGELFGWTKDNWWNVTSTRGSSARKGNELLTKLNDVGMDRATLADLLKMAEPNSVFRRCFNELQTPKTTPPL
jgi:hypothetical protein